MKVVDYECPIYFRRNHNRGLHVNPIMSTNFVVRTTGDFIVKIDQYGGLYAKRKKLNRFITL